MPKNEKEVYELLKDRKKMKITFNKRPKNCNTFSERKDKPLLNMA